jgi:pimeloyl-ACP methyl ester carboxylesterase
MAKTLIVLAPAMSGRTARWRPLKKRLAAEPRLADSQWLDFDHGAWPWTLRTPQGLASVLRAKIEARWRSEGGFDEVILVGHSLGGLLVRQAFLLGSGVFEDRPQVDEWVHHVNRFVLFASVNRGFNPRNLHPLRLLYLLFKLYPLYRMTLACRLEAGSDFITDLRIRWIRHLRGLPSPPAVVQLLGTEDGIVTRADSRDVTQFPNALEIEVPDANHINLYRLDRAKEPEERYCLIRDAFMAEIPWKPAAPPAREKVVFILHGIRASNSGWVEQARADIDRRLPGDVEVVTSSYGYFPALDFAVPPLRNRNIAWFKDTYSYYYALYPSAEFLFLGHSNGTYLLGRALKHVHGMRFARVLLVGSVLPREYPWGEVFGRGQVGALRNDRANRDLPVGLLCSALRGLRMRDLGTAGVDGFNFDDERTSEVFYYDGGHSMALAEKNIGNLVDYLITGSGDDKKRAELHLNKGPGPVFSFLSRSAPLLSWVGLATVAWLAIVFGPALSALQLLVLVVGAVVVVGLARSL